MEPVQIYECLCDPTRLRILHLLTRSALCVCHFQEILGQPQVKISKHLAYLRERGCHGHARTELDDLFAASEATSGAGQKSRVLTGLRAIRHTVLA